MERPGYVAAGNAAEIESERLSLLEKVSDPRTFERMQSIGVGEGWRCLEVGAGGGSVARWLAARVAPGGRIVATDLDTRFLDSLGLAGVEVRRHDILTDDLEPDSFDLVHCRALLLHLRDPAGALARMHSAVRPGGWLFVEDLDVTTVRVADPTHPDAEEFARVSDRNMRAFASMGIFDPAGGRRLPLMVQALGLEDFDHVGVTSIMNGAGPGARFLALGASMTRSLLVERGIATDAEVDEQIRMFEDPSLTFTDSITYQAWGRKRA